MESEKSSIKIVDTGITGISSDAIVNAANTSLQMGGGVCGVIFKRAGVTELQKACDEIKHCDEGSAAITSAFGCPAKFIIPAGIFGYPIYDAWREAIFACKNFINANPDYKINISFAIPTDPKIDLEGKKKFDVGNEVLAKEKGLIHYC